MSNFKIGERVCITGCNEPMMNVPNKNEIVTIHSVCNTFANHYKISEYLFAKDGLPQSFSYKHIRKLDYNFTDDLCAQLIEDAKKETILN